MGDDVISESSSFDEYDYFVFIAFLLISLLIGVFFAIQSFLRQRRAKSDGKSSIDDGAGDAIIGANDVSGDRNAVKRKDSGRETNEFLLGNRNMPMLPVSLSILASFLSANTVMGVPGDHSVEFG